MLFWLFVSPWRNLPSVWKSEEVRAIFAAGSLSATAMYVSRVLSLCLPPMAPAPIACSRGPLTSLATCTLVDHATRLVENFIARQPS